MKPYDGKNGWESLLIEFIGAINYLFSEKNLRDHMKSMGIQATTDWGYLYGEKDFRIFWKCRKSPKTGRYTPSFHIEYICDYLPIFKFFGKRTIFAVNKKSAFKNKKLSIVNVATMAFVFNKFFGEVAPLKCEVKEKGTESIHDLAHPNVFIVPISLGIYKKYTLVTDLDLTPEVQRTISFRKENTLNKVKYCQPCMVLEWYSKDNPFNSKNYIKLLERDFFNVQ